MEVNIQESIKQAQLLWNFEEVIRLKKKLVKINFNHFESYIKYLADCGKLDTIYNEFQAVESSLLYEIINRSNFSACNYLYNLIKNRLLVDNIKDEDNDLSPFIIKLAQFAFHNEYAKLLNLLEKNFDNYFHKDSSAQDNMILNFALNLLMQLEIITPNILIKASRHVVLSNTINMQRKKFLIASIINYSLCHYPSAILFFKLREQFYNHIQTILSFVTQFNNDEYGAATVLNQIYYAIKVYNNIELISKRKPKIAICVSGICKGQDFVALKSLYEHIAKPLNADIFMHTWDIQQVWSGDSRTYSFWQGMFGLQPAKVPSSLHKMDYFKKNYPNLYKILTSTICSNIDKNKLNDTLPYKALLIENEELFLLQNNIGDEYKSRGHFNQIKMIYGIYKSFELMEKYEIETNTKYDYVIRARSDTVFSKSLEFEEIQELSPNSVVTYMQNQVGPADSFFYANRQTYEIVSKILWSEILETQQLSPFQQFSKYDAHALLLLWCVFNDIKLICKKNKFDLANTFKQVKIPDLKEALDIDYANTKNNKELDFEREWLFDTLKDKSL